jgi:hypothetical protein
MKKRRSNIRPSQGTTHNCGCPQNQHFPMRWHGDTWGWRRCFQLPGNPIAGVRIMIDAGRCVLHVIPYEILWDFMERGVLAANSQMNMTRAGHSGFHI